MTLWCKRLDFYTVPQFFFACGAILYYFFCFAKEKLSYVLIWVKKLHPGALLCTPPEGVKGAVNATLCAGVRHSACVEGPAGALASEAPWASTMMILQS